MKLILRLWILTAMLALCCACHDKHPELELIKHTYRSVAVVYMMAENSLSDYASSDLTEIRRGVRNIPDSCLVVVYVDDSSTDKPQLIAFDPERGEQELYTLPDDPLSTDSTTLQEILDLIIERCPARHYGLTLWSHGTGWVPSAPSNAPRKTIGIDNGQNTQSNDGEELEISTLAHILRNTGQQWEYVFFDACFMQGIEVAYELRDVTHWCIGSPAEIPGNGAPYHVIMPHLLADSTEAWRIAEQYFNYYQDNDGLVISAIKTAELDQLAEATATALIQAAAHTEGQFPTTDIQKYFKVIKTGQWWPEFFDMGSAIGHWLTTEEYQTWRAALERAVPYHNATDQWMTSYRRFGFQATVTDREHISCVSMYIPTEEKAANEAFTHCNWHTAGGWAEILRVLERNL